MQKLSRVRALYRCENCGERFEVKKTSLIDHWFKKAHIKVRGRQG